MSPGGYCDLYLLHRLTLFRGVKSSNLFFFWGEGWNYSKYLFGYAICVAIFFLWGGGGACQIRYRNVLGVFKILHFVRYFVTYSRKM